MENKEEEVTLFEELIMGLAVVVIGGLIVSGLIMVLQEQLRQLNPVLIFVAICTIFMVCALVLTRAFGWHKRP